MTLGHELKALDVMKTSGLSMASATLVRELKALDAMNSSGLWFT